MHRRMNIMKLNVIYHLHSHPFIVQTAPRAIGRHVGSAANVLLKYGYKKANDKQRK